MKILWICHFSNSQVREKLHFSNNIIDKVLYYLIYKKKKEKSDFASWITNAIVEFEKLKDIELHITSPYFDIKYKTQEFELNGIHYHFFKPDNNSFFKRGMNKILKKTDGEYLGNRKIVRQLINKINPDVIHMYGAENPYYSITALDIDIQKYPFLISLQTLMSNPDFFEKYSISLEQYKHRVEIEKKVLEKTNYIAAKVTKSRQLVWDKINPNAINIDISLALAQNVILQQVNKEYDFVYFAANINKAADVAIESFAIACEKYPSLTLNIIGGASVSFLKHLKNRIIELKISENVIFSGELPKHDDVLKQIQKSKFALLPLKIDHISGTIREAMFSRLPVVTSETHGTPTLNIVRESVLISKQGDFQKMARNMIKLIESSELSQQLKENGLITVNERWNNNIIMKKQVLAYRAIYDHHHFNKPIPTEIGTTNPAIV